MNDTIVGVQTQKYRTEAGPARKKPGKSQVAGRMVYRYPLNNLNTLYKGGQAL